MITIDELEGYFINEHFLAYLTALGIEPEDAWTMFKLLDADRTGSIHRDEFVFGCMQLRGQARAIQVEKVSYENQMLSQKIDEVYAAIELMREGSFGSR